MPCSCYPALHEVNGNYKKNDQELVCLTFLIFGTKLQQQEDLKLMQMIYLEHCSEVFGPKGTQNDVFQVLSKVSA